MHKLNLVYLPLPAAEKLLLLEIAVFGLGVNTVEYILCKFRPGPHISTLLCNFFKKQFEKILSAVRQTAFKRLLEKSLGNTSLQNTFGQNRECERKLVSKG